LRYWDIGTLGYWDIIKSKNRRNLRLEELEIYQLAMEIGELVWTKVMTWEYFAKKTVGDQLVRSSDSIAANIAEGYGRYFFKERKKFYYYSRGSLLETKSWLTKAKNRTLISPTEYENYIKKLSDLHFKLRACLKF